MCPHIAIWSAKPANNRKVQLKKNKSHKAAIDFYHLTDRNSLWLLLMRLFSPIPKQTLSASSRCYYFSGNLEWPTAPKSRDQHRTTPRKRSSFLRWGEWETLWGSVLYLIHNLARWPVHRPPASPTSAAISSSPPTILTMNLISGRKWIGLDVIYLVSLFFDRGSKKKLRLIYVG